MVESDDEFTELCSKLLKRVKKNKPVEHQGKVSTAANNKLKKTKPSNTKNQVGNGDTKRAEQSRTAGGDLEKEAVHKGHSESNKTEGDTKSETPLIQLPNGHAQKGSDGTAVQTEAVRPQDQLSTKHLVLERMQQFKRAVPNRMRLNAADGCDLELLPSVADPLQNDNALALALQMDLRQQENCLEDEGLFFCQLCQKDLTAMNTALREQHVNRCLDQCESLGGGSEQSLIPSCPLCGKPFSTEKSRASHLKRCAAKLEVPAHTLLQAVQRQTTETGMNPPTRVAAAHTKRKGGSKQKEPAKKRKLAQQGSEVEEMLVAMALSRSLQEEPIAPSSVKVQSARPAKDTSFPEKRSRKKQKAGPAPLLLVQAPEIALQKLQQRVSHLLSEEVPEVNGNIALPQSLFWDKEERESRAWSRPPWDGKDCELWESSKMTENKDSLSYYTAELNPHITQWKPPQQKLLNSQQHTATRSFPAEIPPDPTAKEQSTETISGNGQPQSQSQDSRQALLDLAELAGGGMTLTQWNLGTSRVMDGTDRESLDGITPSGFVPSQEIISKQSNHLQPSAPLVSLAADFVEMVNNPHLSDAQLQTDCGEVLSVHMFVLYSRCPLLVEAVHTEGFWVDEASSGRVRRLLLNDVSAEAALCFLRFLYAACTNIPTHCLPHVCELGRRFAVGSLIDVCEHLVCEPESSGPQDTTEEDVDDGGERAETFQELLKSMWMEEEDEVVVAEQGADIEDEERLDGEGVGEGELDEIYEFAATQRRATEEDEETQRGIGSETDTRHQDMESYDSPTGVRNQVASVTGTQHSTNWRTRSSILNISSLVASSAQIAGKHSSLKMPSSTPASGTTENSPSVVNLVTCAHPSSVPSTTAISPLLPSPTSVSLNTVSSARKCLGDHSTTLPQECLASSSTTISPSGEAEQDFFPLHCSQPLNDSFDRMVSGEALGDGELDEIYKSAATQRRITEEDTHGGRGSETNTRHQNMEYEDSPVGIRNRVASVTGTQHSTDWHTRSSILNISAQIAGNYSPLKKTFASLAADTAETSTIVPLLSCPHPTSVPFSAKSALLPPSDSVSLKTVSPSRQLFVDSSVRSPQQLSVTTMVVGPAPSSAPISPSGGEEAENDLFDQHNSQTLDDSYERMFSETCGEYVEPSSICNAQSKKPVSPTPFHTLPELGSSPDSQPRIRPTHEPSKVSPGATVPAHSSISSLNNSRASQHAELIQGSSCKFTSSPCATSQDPEIILILSSDEETEPDACPTSPPRSGQKSRTGITRIIKESPGSFIEKGSSEGYSHLEMSSSTETSWLVPATPLPHAVGSHVSLLQTSSLLKETQTTTKSFQSTFHSSPTQVNAPTSLALLSQKSPVKPVISQNSSGTNVTLVSSQQPGCSSAGSGASFTLSPLSTSPSKPVISQKSSGTHVTLVSSQQPEGCSSAGSIASLTLSPLSTSPSKPVISQQSPCMPVNLGLTQQPDSRSSTSNKVSLALSMSPASSSVFEVGDSEDEGNQAEAQFNTSSHSFQMDYEPPIAVEDELWFCGKETPLRAEQSPLAHTPSPAKRTPGKASEMQQSSTPLRGSPESAKQSQSPRSSVLKNARLSSVSSQLWDEWEEEDDEELPAVLPLSERLSEIPEYQKQLRTPVTMMRKRELAPKVPITPLPSYSDMDTPVLKKELNRFGVRALPKKQMVLKLKEIFQYTHQVMNSDSEDEVPSSQVNRTDHSSTAQTQRPPVASKQRHLGGKKACTSSQAPRGKKLASVCSTRISAQEVDGGSDRPVTASQESTTSSAGGSDTSSLSQSSATNDFETAFADEDEDEPIPASQQLSREAATAEAVKRYIEDHPELHKRILLYQPLELAAIQAELKQSGIKMAAGKLLDFLDSHCVTFTTAAARKEKTSRGKRKRAKRP
ncbi:structure-specific endonuclease subunit SLX4 [Rhinophrynus dorsalis]